MDETENNEEKTHSTGSEQEVETMAQKLPAADQEMMKSEGVEIVGMEDSQEETPAPARRVEPRPAAPPPQFKPVERPFTSVTKLPQDEKYDIKNIRTYKSDAEEAVKKNNTSVIDIAVAESKRKENTPVEYPKEKTGRGFLWTSIIIIVVAFLIAAGAYYFWVLVPNSTSSKPVAEATVYPSLIISQKTQTISIDPKNSFPSVASGIENNSSAPVGSIVNFIPVEQDGVSIASSTDFFALIGIQVPTQVAIALDGQYMLGAFVSNPNHPFIILGLSSFENAFAGMLSWEKTMRGGFGGFITIDHSNEPVVPTIMETFTDKTIQNQDVRELLNASSSPILMYTFVGTTKLVIATDENTLSSVIADINTTNSVR